MSEDLIVHFVFFETKLDSEQFIPKWHEYSQSENISENVTMQQSAKENGFRYIAQHHCEAGEFDFVFEKGRRSSRIRQVQIITTLAGGYSITEAAKTDHCIADESKVFAFLSESSPRLEPYIQLADKGKVNIYQAYYENCKFAYILEYFVKDENAADLLESLKQHNSVEMGIYKECAMQLS